MVLERPWQPTIEAPSGTSPDETRLYQLLYVGEYGEQAQAAGQQVRMLAWLRTLPLSDKEMVALAQLGIRAKREVADDHAARQLDDAREMAVLGPIYARITAALSHAATTPDELALLGKELAEAQASLAAEDNPRARHRARVHSLLIGVAAWMSDLTHEQRVAMGSCRFVLLEHAAPLTNPSTYASLVGMVWDRGDFSALQTGDDIVADGPLDIGGLWALEHLRAPPSGYMIESAREGMVLMALLDPAFLPAVEVALRVRGVEMPVEEAAPASP